jgi:mono/diheme cytochrome c family protein
MVPTASSSQLSRLALVAVLSVGFALLAAADVPAGQEPDAQVLELGKTVYTDQCQSCHGPEGKGDGPAARFLSPPARDLTQGDWQYAEDGTVEAIAAVIRSGIDDTGMTPFEGQLSDEEINAVATYVLHELVVGGGEGR